MISALITIIIGLSNPTVGYAQLSPIGDLWAVDVKIDGKPAKLLIDTGSPSSALYAPFVVPQNRTVKLAFGEVSREGTFQIRASVPSESKDINGILGLDNLRGWQVLFDFQKRKLIVGSDIDTMTETYNKRRKELFDGSASNSHSFKVSASGHLIFSSPSNKIYALDTGSGGLFARREEQFNLHSLGKWDVHLFDRTVQRQVYLVANTSMFGLDLSPLFEPESAQELPSGIDGAYPLNDLVSRIILLDMKSNTFSMPRLDPIKQRLVNLSKCISYNVTESNGKLIVGAAPEVPETKDEAKLAGFEIVAIGDVTGSEILNWVKKLDAESLADIAGFIERRKSDMVMLLRSENRLMRGKLVGTKF